jgi:pimeloyl-ACP methyl ester carboxylesterase
MLSARVNGIDLAYLRSGNGKPLVLLHGYPLDHSIWLPVAARLEKACSLVLPDLPGFGRSGLASAGFSLDDMADDLAALLDALGIHKIALAGHSMGGYVALAFARKCPARLESLVLVASHALADTPERQVSRTEEAQLVMNGGLGQIARSMAGKLTGDPMLQSEIERLINRQKPEALAGALLAMAARQSSENLLASLSSPVVFIQGDKDKLIPLEMARDMHKLAKKSRLFIIKDAGHLPMMEKPAETARALRTLIYK